MLDIIIGRHIWILLFDHTSKEWPNTHARAYEDMHTKNPNKNKTKKGPKKGGKREQGKERREERENKKLKRGKRKRKDEKEGNKKKGRKKGKRKRGWGGFRGRDRGAWVLKRVEPHTKHARST